MDNFVSGVVQNLIANWIGYLLSIVIAALIAAWGKMGIKWSGPMMVTAGLVVVASVLVIYSCLIGWSIRPVGASDWSTYSKVRVVNKQFRNEKIVLDGKSFIGCTFENVTFEYNGTAPVDMVENKIIGERILMSKNIAIDMIMFILRDGIHFLPETIRLEPKNE